MPDMSRLAAVLAAFVIALAACGGPSPSASPSPAASPSPITTPGVSASAMPAASATPMPSGEAAAIYREIEDQVIAERGLPATERLEPTIITEAEARKQIAERYRAKNPPDTIATAEATLKALGLLAPDASLESLYLDLIGSQVAAFYVPETGKIFVISKTGSIGAVEKTYFSHEFTHALQDQNFGTDVNVKGQGDRSLARLSLLEGDASLLMARWMIQHLDSDELQELLQIDPEVMAQLERMPAILRETLLFPYQQGLILVNGLWAKGGWKAVDAAYGRPPDSTEQVLHPEKYEAGEKPVDVPLDADALATAMGTGWSGTPEDTLGEFQLSVWLRENGIKALAAGDAAEGWGGDRLAYLRGPNGAYALVMRTAWDSAAEAAEFLTAAGTVVGDEGSSGTVVRTSPSEVVVVLASDGGALNAAVDAAGLNLPD